MAEGKGQNDCGSPEAMWFSVAYTPCPIGIVFATNSMGVRKAYIGLGLGYNEKEDMKKIIEWGARLELNIAEEIVRRLK